MPIVLAWYADLDVETPITFFLTNFPNDLCIVDERVAKCCKFRLQILKASFKYFFQNSLHFCTE